MRAHLSKDLTDATEDARAVIRVDFNDLTDKQDGLQRGESGFSLELQELAHEWAHNHWNRNRVALRNLVN